MKAINLVISSGLVALVAGCGIGTNGSDESADLQRRDAKVLEQRFQQVRGTYEGTLTNPATGLGPLRAKLTLYVMNVSEAPNPNGSIRIRPALVGRFELQDVASVTDYMSLNGDYNELGELNLSGSGTAEKLSVKGTIFGGKANVALVRNRGPWGVFEGDRTTHDASMPSSDDEAAYRNKLLRVLTPVEGVYIGVLDGADRVKVSITITIGEDVATGNPILVGRYRRLDVPSGVADRGLAVEFDSTTGVITMRGTSGGGTVPGSDYFSGTGTWKAEVLSVKLTDHRGPLGKLSATRSPLY
ncbi:MAG: hypothetical protein V4760_14625 [Bdellovibrionota bacterium]